MNATKALGALATVLLITAPAVHAAEGRIPIFEPTVIDGTSTNISGKYVVTNDITAATAVSVIQVIGNGSDQNVEIDLNGFTVTGHAAGPPAIQATGLRSFTLRNGSVTGTNSGTDAVSVTGTSGTDDTAVIENIKVSGGDEQIQLVDVNNFAIRSNVIVGVVDVSGSGIEISGSEVLTGLLAENVIRDTAIGIDVQGKSKAVTIRDNHVLNEVVDAIGIRIEGSGGANPAQSLIVTGNNVVGGGSGIFLRDTDKCRVSGNVVSNGQFTGLEMRNTDDCLVDNNVFSSNGADGIDLRDSQRNQIDHNQLSENGDFGIRFRNASQGDVPSDSDQNTYGRNTMRGNAGGTCNIAGSGSGGPCGVPAVCDATPWDHTNPADTETNRSFGDNLTDSLGPC